MNKKFVIDLAERVSATFAEAFITAVTLSGLGVDHVTGMSLWRKAAVSAGVAAAAVLKGGLAKFIGKPDSASLAPSVGPTTTGE